MTIESIAAVTAAPMQAGAAQRVQPGTDGNGFGAWFASEINAVNATLARSDMEVRQLVAGKSVRLHEVMIHLEEAKLSFQLLAQVRNHLLEAYQDIMRTQV
jgi:flagellar hook-basal body complex protein FliE